MQKKAVIASIAISLLGIIGEVIYSFNDNFSKFWFYFYEYCRFLSLGFFEEKGFFETFSNVNSINLLFYLFFLFGGILYGLNPKESRLIRFMFSLVLYSKALTLAWFIIRVVFTLRIVSGPSINYLWLTTALAWECLIIFVCWKTLQYFDQVRQIEVIEKVYGDYTSNILVEASRWQRFFHHVFDTLILVLVFSPMLAANMDFLRSVEHTFGEQLGPWIILLGARLLYFLPFESILQVSPSKLLSETRVVNEYSGKVPAGRIFVRTLSRLIPFEAFSFFMSRGWHDELSGSYVVKEKRKGIKGGWYFLLVPVTALLIVLSVWGFKKLHYMEMENREKEGYSVKHERLKKRIDNLTINDVIAFESASYAEPRTVFLKPEKINGQIIEMVRIEPLKKSYSAGNGQTMEAILNGSQADIERAYREQKGTAETITMKRDLLAHSNPDFEAYDAARRTGTKHIGIDLFNNGIRYTIRDIEPHFGPNIVLENAFTFQSGGRKSVTLYNKGWPVTVDKITDKARPGSFWNVTGDRIAGQFQLYTMSQDTDEKIDLVLSIRDTLGRPQTYRITGESRNGNREQLSIEKIR